MQATLASLRIKNLALVEELHWKLKPGFVAVTGETGAGKSVILGALKLLLGERADKNLIRTGSDSCTVEAIFEIQNSQAFDAVLEQHGIDSCSETDGQLTIKRTLTQAGSNRQFINGSPTTLTTLKLLGDQLVDLHGPHDHQSLLSTEKQLDLLDAFSHAEEARDAYHATFRRLTQLRNTCQELASDEASLERERDLLRHQMDEIFSARLEPNEEEEIRKQYTLVSNSRRLIELATGAASELSESEPSILSRLNDVSRTLRELEKIDPSTGHFFETHNSAVVELEELATSLTDYTSQLDLDPKQLTALEERLSLIETLKRKYGNTLKEVIEFGENASVRLKKIEGRGEERVQWQEEIAAAEKTLLAQGEKLSKLRKQAVPKLTAVISNQLRDLGFKKSEFDIRLVSLETPSAQGLETIEFIFSPRSTGLETVEFLFAPNPGEPPKPLRSIASSGEISRVMLAVKSAVAEQDEIPLLVFDEIDANVGGEIAHAVGAKMRSLGRNHQVLCITHLPQVAASAESHFVVSKEFEQNRTFSRLTQVQDEARIRELTRMLGAQGEAAVALAKSLLER